MFFKPLPVEIIVKTENRRRIRSFDENIVERLLETLKRSPCSKSELEQSLNIHINDLNKYLGKLIKKEAVTSKLMPRGLFFKLER